MGNNRLNNKNGFTLIEAMIAMGILSIGIMSIYTMQVSSIRGNATASRITTASGWNVNQMETLLGMDYLHAVGLQDTDSDGTNQDNDDGVDDTGGGNFGMDDYECCPDGNDPAGNAVAGCTKKSDGCAIGSQNKNFVYWNVAVDVPMVNLKTIRIHVFDVNQSLTKPITFTYIKADMI